MGEGPGSSHPQPEQSGEVHGTLGPSIRAPLVQAKGRGETDATATRSQEFKAMPGSIASVTQAEEVESSGLTAGYLQDLAARPRSGSLANAPPEGQHSHDRDIGPMSTAHDQSGAAAQGTNIVVDTDYLEDTDSAVGEGDELSSYSTSIASSVRANYYEHGRRYSAYKDSGYIRPNDEMEVDRLDMMHHVFKTLSDGKLYEAPLPKDVHRVLDLGCGTGLWAIEFADDHPSAEVLGVDLSPIQPQFVPPNLKFEIDDIEEDFTYRRPFDFIHCRYMAYAIKDWPRLMSQVYAHTVPGGWVEFTDMDLNFRSDDGTLEGTTLKSWADALPEAGRSIGREPCPGPRLEEWIRNAGFTNVVAKVYKLPVGPWPKDPQFKLIGAYYHVTLVQGIEGFSLRIYLNILKWKYEELQVLMANVRKDLNTRSIHSYTMAYRVYAQKPGGPST